MNKNTKLIALVSLAVLLLGYLFVVQPRMESEDLEGQIYSRYRLLAKYRSLEEESSHLGADSDALVGELKGYGKSYLKGQNPSLGAAELQKIVGGYAADAGLQLLTVKPMPFVERDEFVEVPLQFDFRGDIEALRDFSVTLGAKGLGLRVSKLSVSVVNVREPSVLNIKIAIHGIMKL